MRLQGALCAFMLLLLCGCGKTNKREADAQATADPKFINKPWKAKEKKIKPNKLELEDPSPVIVRKGDPENTVLSWKRPKKTWTVTFDNNKSPCLDLDSSKYKLVFSGKADEDPPDDRKCFISVPCLREDAQETARGRFCVYTYTLSDGEAQADPEVLIEEGVVPPSPDELQRLRQRLRALRESRR